MTEYLWVIVWMLLDNAEQVFDACLFGVIAGCWWALSLFGLFVILIIK